MGCSNCSKEPQSPLNDSLPQHNLLMEAEEQWLRDTLETHEEEGLSLRSIQPELSKILTESGIDSESAELLVDRLNERVKDLDTYNSLYFEEIGDIQQLCNVVKSLRLENEEIRKRMESVEALIPMERQRTATTEKLQKVVKSHIFTRLITAQERLISDTFKSWQIRSLKSKTIENSLPNSLKSSTDFDYILIESDKLTKSNPILRAIRKQGKFRTSFMPKIRLFHLFEDTLREKYDADLHDSANVRPLNEFMCDFLTQKFELPTIAFHELNRFVLGLFRLYRDSHPYGVVIARLLGLFHPEPIATEVTSYIVKAKGKIDRLRKAMSISASQSADVVKSGDFAHLEDLLTFVYQSFAGYPELGKLAVSLLKPDTTTQEDYFSFQVCHKVASTGKQLQELFKVVDPRNIGLASSKQAAVGICNTLGLWADVEEIRDFAKVVVDCENYYGSALRRDLQVAMHTYICVLVDVYDHMIALHNQQLADIFADCSSSGCLTRLKLQQAISRLDPQLTQSQIRNLIVSIDGVLDLSRFRQIVFGMKIGGMGIGPFRMSIGQSLSQRMPLHERNSISFPEVETLKPKQIDINAYLKP